MLHIDSYQSISQTCCVESSITTVNCHTIVNSKPLVSIWLETIWCIWLYFTHLSINTSFSWTSFFKSHIFILYVQCRHWVPWKSATCF